MRKFVIGFVSLFTVLGAFLLYSRLSKTPRFDSDTGAELIESVSDANAAGLDGDIGKIGDVGLGPVQKAKFITLNKDKQVEREFGFEKLLNESRDLWDIEDPYMNIFRRNFKCYVTADRGKVQVETAVGRTTPKDATFSSNVVVRIISGPEGDTKESTVYLDDIIFLSERSRLSTAGPVKYVSDDVRMDGTGLELIYNEQTERLEYFKIDDLESLHITGSPAAVFSAGKMEETASSDGNKQALSQQPEESAVVAETKKMQASAPVAKPQSEEKEGVYYKCTFTKNVLVNTPEQLIFAGDKLRINDIFWSKSSSDEPNNVDAGGTDENKEVTATVEPVRQAADSTVEQDVTVSKPAEPNLPPEKPDSILVTCDSGFVVVPRDSARAVDDQAGDDAGQAVPGDGFADGLDDETERTRFFTRKIDYNATTGDGISDGLSELTFYVGSTSAAEVNEPPVPVTVTARKGAKFSQASNKVVFEGDCLVTMPQSGLTEPKDVTFTAPEITVNLPEDKSKKPDMLTPGPAELVFHMEDANNPDPNKGPIPVTVNAQRRARFSAAANQIIFEGDCRCSMLREDPNALVKYILLSEQITVDLPADTNDRSAGPAAGIKHLTATGEVVRLATTKTAKAEGAFAGQMQVTGSEKPLGGVELKCKKFDYDAVEQLFIATGPGVIKLNNSGVSDPNEQTGRLNLRKPCWAVLSGFEILTYFVRENRIVADASPGEKLRIDYLPAVDGHYNEYITATASHVEALLFEGPEGQTELSTLRATGGIEYEDKDSEFLGSELFYDHDTSILTVKGDDSRPCYYNGALVGGIEMNVKTGKVEAEIVGPGTLRINR